MVYYDREDTGVSSCVAAGAWGVEFSGLVSIEGLGPEVGLGHDTEGPPLTSLPPANHYLQKVPPPPQTVLSAGSHEFKYMRLRRMLCIQTVKLGKYFQISSPWPHPGPVR